MTLPSEAPAAAGRRRGAIDRTLRAGAGPSLRPASVPLHAVVILIVIVVADPDARPVRQLVPARARTCAGSGWWTALTPPWHFTLDNYAHVLGQNDLGDAFINSLFITIPATVIPIVVASFAAYAFAWMQFPFETSLFVVVVALLVDPAPVDVHPDPAAVGRGRHRRASSWRSGWPTRATACRSRSSCCATTWAGCHGRSSSRPRSTAPATRRRSSGSRSR